MSIKWLLIAGGIFILFVAYRAKQTPFDGFVNAGWGGGNALANLPGLLNPQGVVGNPAGAMAYPGPGVPFRPSNSTNGGSAGSG